MKASGFLARQDRYTEFLECTWRARLELESSLDENQAHRFFAKWPERRIAKLLSLDYRDVTGVELDEPKPAARRTPQLSAAEIFGILYVLEGSSLGAGVIALATSEMGFGPTWGARHLAHQAGDRDAWTSFQIELENHPMSEADEASCIAAASRAFRQFEQTYAKAIPNP